MYKVHESYIGVMEAVSWMNTSVADFIYKNVKKTDKKGGDVVVVHNNKTLLSMSVKDSEGKTHRFKANFSNGNWKVEVKMSQGAPMNVIGNKKTIDDDMALAAVKSIFDKSQI